MIMLQWCNWHIETFQEITSKTQGRLVLHKHKPLKQETTPPRENVEDTTEVSGVSSSPSYPAQTWCVFVQLGPKHNQPSAARRGEPGEGRTRREQKASVAGKESLSLGTKRRSGWVGVGVGRWLLLGVLLPERWQLKGTRERKNKWIWMRKDGCPSTGPPRPSQRNRPSFSLSRSPSRTLWLSELAAGGGTRAHTHMHVSTHKHIQRGCLALVATVTNRGHTLQWVKPVMMIGSTCVCVCCKRVLCVCVYGGASKTNAFYLIYEVRCVGREGERKRESLT